MSKRASRRRAEYIPPVTRISTFLAGANVAAERTVRFQSAASPTCVELLREPDNKHDPNAVAVHLNGHLVGYVPRDCAAELAPKIDAGMHHGGFLKRIDVSPDGSVWADLIIGYGRPDTTADHVQGLLQDWFDYYDASG